MPLNSNYKRNDEVLPKVNRGTHTAPRAASHNATARHPPPPRSSSTTYAQAAAAVSHIPRIDSTTARQWGASHSPPDSAPGRDTVRPRSSGSIWRGAARGGGGRDSTYHTPVNHYYNTDPNIHRYQNSYAHASTRRGCYNCGELNHQQATCRFDHRLQCHYCNKLNHKQRQCNMYYNQ